MPLLTPTTTPKHLRWVLLLVLSAGIFPAFAAATPPEAAEALIKEGLDLRRAGKDADAISKFEEAYAIAKSPRAAAQLGLCFQAVSRWSEADPFIAEALTAFDDPWVNKNRQVLKDSLEEAKKHLARIEVLGQPEGARVMVNGMLVGTLPLKKAAVVNEGPVDIEVTATGHRPEVRKLTATGASYQRLVFRLEKAALETLPVAKEPAPPSERHVDLRDSVPPDPGAEERPGSRTWLWVGAATVLVGVGILSAVLMTSGGEKPPSVANSFKFD